MKKLIKYFELQASEIELIINRLDKYILILKKTDKE